MKYKHLFKFSPVNILRMLVGSMFVITATITTTKIPVSLASDFNKGIFSNGFTIEDINVVLANFSNSFEKGDINNFIELFDEKVRAEEGEGRENLKQDYLQLFDSTFKRKIKFKDASWRENDVGMIWGDVDFDLKIGNRVDGKTKPMSGTMRLYFKKESKHLVITAIFHVYD